MFASGRGAALILRNFVVSDVIAARLRPSTQTIVEIEAALTNCLPAAGTKL